jgi:hypothetical protein
MGLKAKEFFAVTARCGHVGLDYYIPIVFPVKATSASEAVAIATQIPRVKHDHPDRILDVRPIDKKDFYELRECNSRDPYLKCRSVQEQRALLPYIEERLVKEEGFLAITFDEKDFSSKSKTLFAGKVKIKKPRVFQRFNSF